MEIKIERAKTLKEKPGADQELGFGKFYTDHMFVMDWDIGQGWHDARIVPFGPIQMDPASMVLHYAQETFEGLKGCSFVMPPMLEHWLLFHSDQYNTVLNLFRILHSLLSVQ